MHKENYHQLIELIQGASPEDLRWLILNLIRFLKILCWMIAVLFIPYAVLTGCWIGKVIVEWWTLAM